MELQDDDDNDANATYRKGQGRRRQWSLLVNLTLQNVLDQTASHRDVFVSRSKARVLKRSNQKGQRKRWKPFLFAASSLAFIVWIYCHIPSSSNDPLNLVTLVGPRDQRHHNAMNGNNKNETKYILYYTPFWNHKDYKFGFGQEPFQVCPHHQDCFVTDNRQHLASMGDFDAVVFHSIDFRYDVDVSSIEQWRRPQQRFVYFNVESPQTYASPDAPGFFNWTMTYRHDSDIVRPYGWFHEKHKTSMYPPPLQTTEWPIVYEEQEFEKQDLKSLLHLAKRPKKIAWIVSNCNTASRRDDYVRELSKYIPVDIFGKCGTTPCDVDYQTGSNKFDNCTLAVNKHYKFYLSFENTLCKDYVTEKFFSRVNQSVAIVMGGANYSQVAPPHSYINVMDYASPRELAKYLLELDRNDSLYLSYFWFQRHYQVQTGSREMQVQSFCQLCNKLHSQTEPTKSYANLRKWWNIDAHCGEPKVPGIQATPSLRVDWGNG